MKSKLKNKPIFVSLGSSGSFGSVLRSSSRAAFKLCILRLSRAFALHLLIFLDLKIVSGLLIRQRYFLLAFLAPFLYSRLNSIFVCCCWNRKMNYINEMKKTHMLMMLINKTDIFAN